MGRQILFIGIGQTGCTVAEMFSRKISKDGIFCRAVCFDTDKAVLEKLNMSYAVPLIDSERLCKVAELIGCEKLSPVFPCLWENDFTEFAKGLDMQSGSGGWRMKALLSFYSYLAKAELKQELFKELSAFNGDVELYVAASLAGGTGSGLLIPITLYLKKYIKSIGGNIVNSYAALAMPNIFENVLSAEQRVKSRANAYCALRELDFVNSVAQGERSNRFKEAFKIGLDCEGGSLIFDSEDKKFADREYMPFDKVYLFERVKGLFSVDANADIIAEGMLSFCRCGKINGTEKLKKKTTSVYAGISLTKIIYPKDSIIKYITKKQLYNFTFDELSVYSRAEEIAAKSALARREYGGQALDSLLEFCKAYIESAEEGIEGGGFSLPLLKRNYAQSASDGCQALQSGEDAFLKLLNNACECFECDEKQALYKKIDALQLTRKELKKRSINEKKHFYDTASKLWEGFNEYFLYGAEMLRENKELLKELASGSSGFSVEKDVLSENGTILHPTYALYKLCTLYKELDAYIKANKNSVLYIQADAECVPSFVFDLKEAEKQTRLYEKAGESRLRLVLSGERNKKQKQDSSDSGKERAQLTQMLTKLKKSLYASRKTFVEDVKFAAERLSDSLAYERMRAAFEYIGELVDKYRALLRSVYKNGDDINEGLKLAGLYASGDSVGTVNLCASLENKARMCERYIADYFKGYELPEEDDRYIGGLFSDALFSFEQISAEKLCSGIEEIYENSLLKSDFYKENIDKSIFEAILEDLNTGSEAGRSDAWGIGSAKIFSGRNISLILTSPENFEDRRAVERSVAAILPESVKDEIELSGKNKTPEEAVEGMMYNAGEYLGRAVFVKGMPRGEMYVRREEASLPLYMVEFMRDDMGGAGPLAYKKAMDISRLQKTQMWNPELIYKRDVSGAEAADNSVEERI